MPYFRLNIYVEGSGGEGKGLFIKFLAKQLSSQGTYFSVGGKNVVFEGYKGEEVIIWDDMRASEVLSALGGEGNVMNVLDPFPDELETKRQNIKFDSICLVNRVNIFNSVQPYEEFLKELVSHTVDRRKRKQSYRRFPMIIRLHPEDFDMLLNAGFLYDTREFEQYIQYNHIRGNFATIASVCKRNASLRDEIMERTLEPVVTQITALEDKVSKQQIDEAAIRELTKNYGLFDIAAIEKENQLQEDQQEQCEEYQKHLEAQQKEKEYEDKIHSMSIEELIKDKLRIENEKFEDIDMMFDVNGTVDPNRVDERRNKNLVAMCNKSIDVLSEYIH